MAVTYLKCMMMVAAFHHFPPTVLPAIQHVEGGAPGLVSNNQNGTQDLGVMQINTRWIRPLMEATHESGAMIYQKLKQDSCYNIAVAGAILKFYQMEANGNLMQAIGYYHSHSFHLGNAYRFQVIQFIYRDNMQTGKGLAKTPFPRQKRLLQKKFLMRRGKGVRK